MSTDRHRAAVIAAIEAYTKRMTVDRETARAALIAEGIYTEDGELAPEYGGPGWTDRGTVADFFAENAKKSTDPALGIQIMEQRQ